MGQKTHTTIWLIFNKCWELNMCTIGTPNSKDLGWLIALSWFQAIPRNSCANLKAMEKDFIEDFIKTRVKHNTVAFIYSFKQASHKISQIGRDNIHHSR